MQQIVFKRKCSVLFDAVKTKNEQYLEEKIQSIKKIVIKKIQKKKSLKILILRNLDQFSKNIFSRRSCSIPKVFTYQSWYQ